MIILVGPRFTRKFMTLMCAAALTLAASAHAQFDHQHKVWGELLKKHVVLVDGGKASQMRYAALARDRDALKAYLATLSKVTQQEYGDWSKNQQLAFLINAYNAHMAELILTRYPDIKSVWDFGKIFNNPFKNRFFMLLGREFSLDNVEHDTIRAKGAFDEPRIHFAVNCASVGCPMLREDAYVGERLGAQLEEQTVRFLSDRSRNRYNAQTRALEVSKIFDWYGVDFAGGLRDIQSREQFFAKYAAALADDPAHRKLIAQGDVAIHFLDYDWKLNDAQR